MRWTWKCKVVCSVLGFAWVTALIASMDAALGTAEAWWWAFLGGSTMSNLLCVTTASLVLWKLAAPSGTTWRIAEGVGYAAGRRDALQELGDRRTDGRRTVVPFPRQPANSS